MRVEEVTWWDKAENKDIFGRFSRTRPIRSPIVLFLQLLWWIVPQHSILSYFFYKMQDLRWLLGQQMLRWQIVNAQASDPFSY